MSDANNVVRLCDVTGAACHWSAWDAVDAGLDGMLEAVKGDGHIHTMVLAFVDGEGCMYTYQAGTDAATALLAAKVAQRKLDGYSFGVTDNPGPPDLAA